MIYQRSPHSVSASIGVWLKVGSLYENKEERGYTHFIEHMLFKGTKNRTAKELVEAVEKAGGFINAATSREYTYYYVTVSMDKISLALDVLSDMVFNPLFKEKDCKNESGVIVEEMKSYRDSPDDFVYDMYFKTIFKNHPIGLDTLGTEESIQNATSKKLRAYYNQFYSPSNMTVVISSPYQFKEVIDPLIEKYFSKSPDKEFQSVVIEDITKQKFTTNFYQRKLNQVSFVLGGNGRKRSFDSQVKLNLFTSIFGGGMSSRLFQRIREDKGLCYSISCFSSSYTCGGVVNISCATSKDKFLFCLDSIRKEIKNLKKHGFTKTELEDIKSNQTGLMSIAFETPDQKMINAAIQNLYYGKYYTFQERVNAIQSVTLDDLNEVIHYVFSGPNLHLAGLGSLSKAEIDQINTSI